MANNNLTNKGDVEPESTQTGELDERALMVGTDKSLAQILPPGKLTPVSLQLPKSLNHTQWKDVGIVLIRLGEAQPWWIGDWWAFGEHKYGERKAIVEDDDWTGPSFGTCANNASVCRVFETSRRRELLSFSHHQFFVGRNFEPELVGELLDWCEAPLKNGAKRPRSVSDLESEIQRRENRAVYDQVIRGLDKRILQCCKNLSKAKAKVFKGEIIKKLGDELDLRNRWGQRLKRVDLEMLTEKIINDTLGGSGDAGDAVKLIEFIGPIRKWRVRTAEEFDEIVAAVPIELARDDLGACRWVIRELQIFIEQLEARITELEASGVEIPPGALGTTAQEWIQDREDRAERAACRYAERACGTSQALLDKKLLLREKINDGETRQTGRDSSDAESNRSRAAARERRLRRCAANRNATVS